MSEVVIRDKECVLKIVRALAPKILQSNSKPLRVKVAFTVDGIWALLGQAKPLDNEYGLLDIGTERDVSVYHFWEDKELLWFRLPTTMTIIKQAISGLKQGNYDPL